MHKGFKSVTLIILSLLLVVAFTGCAKKTSSGGASGSKAKLAVGTDNSFKPFCYRDESGKIVGFDIDMWDALAKQAGLEYEIKPMDFSAIINSVSVGTLDAAVAGITIKDDRKKKVDFSDPYYDAGLAVLVRSDEDGIKSADDLKGKTIATKTATTSYDYAKKIDGANVVPFKDITLAYEELVTGKADAVIFDSPNVGAYAQGKGKGQVKIVAEIPTGEQYGIAFTKDSPYRAPINEALKTIVKNGTYEKLYVKWFGKKPASLPGQSGS